MLTLSFHNLYILKLILWTPLFQQTTHLWESYHLTVLVRSDVDQGIFPLTCMGAGSVPSSLIVHFQLWFILVEIFIWGGGVTHIYAGWNPTELNGVQVRAEFGLKFLVKLQEHTLGVKFIPMQRDHI